MLKKILACIIAASALTITASGQQSKPATPAQRILPANNALLNYRLAGFSVPANVLAKQYLFEIAQDSLITDADFEAKVIIKETTAKHRTVQLLPSFGKQYTWRSTLLDAKGKVLAKSKLYHFKTSYAKTIDTAVYRMRIIKEAQDHKDMYVLLDFSLVMYDMNGEPVWYLPDIPVISDKERQMRDLKPTKDGTFTALNGFGAYEFDYNGRVLWSKSSDIVVGNDSNLRFHHEFTKMSNGHYIVAGNQNLWRKIPGDRTQYTLENDPLTELKPDGNYYKKIISGNLVELDKNGNIVWYWKSSQHFGNNDYFRKRRNSMPFHSNLHMNAFAIDEANKSIYISFRDINRVIKIKYPSGEIVKSYGEIRNDSLAIFGTSPFFGQHNCRVNDKNQLYLFDNNTKGLGAATEGGLRKTESFLSVYNQPDTGNNLELVWQFSCNIDTNALPGSGAGGSVIQLEDGCMLSSMGAASRVFIVTPDKQIIWNVMPEVSDDSKRWSPLGEYRASYLKKEDIEKFIFREEGSKIKIR